MKQLAEPFMGFLLLFLVFLVSRYGTEQVLSEQALAGLKQPKQPVVVVDAGHGGNDPGKRQRAVFSNRFQEENVGYAETLPDHE